MSAVPDWRELLWAEDYAIFDDPDKKALNSAYALLHRIRQAADLPSSTPAWKLPFLIQRLRQKAEAINPPWLN